MSTIKKFLGVILAAIFIILMFFWLKGDFLGKEKVEPGKTESVLPTPAPGAATTTVEESTVTLSTEAVGTLLARFSTEISPKILATILDIPVTPGADVKQGDLLAILDDRDVKARLDQAMKGLEAAQAALTQSKQDYERYKDLYEKGVESREVFEQQQTALKVAQARVEQAEAGVDEAEVLLSYTKIFAPYDGRITDKALDEGEVAQPGRPIMTMYNPERLRLEANVPESLTPFIEVGKSFTVRIDAVNLEETGIVEEIVPTSDVQSRTFITRVSVPYTPGLYEGMFGRLIIPTGERQALLVPRSAVFNVGQIEMVQIRNEEGRIEKCAVQTGKTFGDDVEILSGLKPGDTVMLDINV